MNSINSINELKDQITKEITRYEFGRKDREDLVEEEKKATKNVKD